MSRDFQREGGRGERRCLADKYLIEGVFLSNVVDFRNDMTVEWLGNSLSSPSIDGFYLFSVTTK